MAWAARLTVGRNSSVTLAFATNLTVCRTGGILNFYTTGKLVGRHGITSSTWLVTAVAILPTMLGALYLIIFEAMGSNTTETDIGETFCEAVRRLPRAYWGLAKIVITASSRTTAKQRTSKKTAI
jgi:hypothetical protein